MSVAVARRSLLPSAVVDYLALTKPRVVSLLVVTGVCGYLAGAAGHVRIGVILASCFGYAMRVWSIVIKVKRKRSAMRFRSASVRSHSTS